MPPRIEIEVKDLVPQFMAMYEGDKQIMMEKLGMTMENYGALELERAPRRIKTGTLRRSITHELGDNEVVVGTNIDYAFWVHDGTRRMAPNRFLRNALAQHKGDYEGIIRRSLHK